MGMNISLNTVNFGFVAENNRFIIVHLKCRLLWHICIWFTMYFTNPEWLSFSAFTL